MKPTEFIEQFESIKIPILGVRLPEFIVTEEYKKQFSIEKDMSNFDFLRHLCLIGFKKLNLQKNSNEYKEYSERVKYELEIIKELGFTDYLLLVWDIINFCSKNNIPTGLGRGSAAGSLVVFFIGITKINPIKYGLYFERFISKIRARKTTINGVDYLDGSLCPDIDCDVDYYRRQEVLKYINDKYQGKTAKILTFNTLSSKLVIKEVGKIFGAKPEEEMTHVTSMIPKIHGQIEDLDKAYASVSEFRDWCNANKETYDIAMKLKDLIKNKGVHPSGIMISYDKLEDICPVELSSDKDLVSSYDMNQVSLFSLKVDILGLRGVSVVDDVCKMLKINVEDIDVADKSTYEHLQNLKYPHGLFQIEADLGFKTTQKVKPHNFNELSAILALARPGSMAFIDDYAHYTNSGEVPNFDIESDKLKKIMAETGGIILYQETLMQIAKEVFELTLDDAEQIRRACGKKKIDDMNKYKDIIYNQGQKLGIPKSAKFYWDALIASADYSFNKCLHPDTIITTRHGYKPLSLINIGDNITSFDAINQCNIQVEVKDKIYGEQELFQIILSDDREIICSLKHKFLTNNVEMKSIQEILDNNLEIVTDEKQEIFRGVLGFEGLYKISNLGTIISLPRKCGNNRFYGGKTLTPYLDKDGYLRVEIKHKQNIKKYFIHRLVAQAFLPNPQNLPCINHKNGIKTDNRIDNLEWVTIKQNNIHAVKTGLSHPSLNLKVYYGSEHYASKFQDNEIIDIRQRSKSGDSFTNIAKFYNVSISTIARICKNQTYKIS
jgi:hypothetical protein